MTRTNDLGEAVHFVFSFQFWRMAVLWTFSLIFSYFRLWFAGVFVRKFHSYPRHSPAYPATAKRPVCVITGATSGLGAAAASALSTEGFFVVLEQAMLLGCNGFGGLQDGKGIGDEGFHAGRSTHLLSKTIEDIKERQPDAHLKAIQVDLLSFQSMLKFKSSLQQWLLDSDMHHSIQLLINNAGILATSYRFSAEGYDQMMGTNYIGAFILSNLLLPLLKSSSVPSRIVNVTSFTHRCVSNIQVDEETLVGKCSLVSKQYPCTQIYEYTKFFLVLFSYKLHRQLGLDDKSNQVSVIAADPGAVETSIMREVPSHLSLLAYTVLKLLGLLQAPEYGVNSIIDAALAPPETSGEYFFGGSGRTIDSSALSYDNKLAEKLWTSSYKLFLELQLAYKEAS